MHKQELRDSVASREPGSSSDWSMGDEGKEPPFPH